MSKVNYSICGVPPRIHKTPRVQHWGPTAKSQNHKGAPLGSQRVCMFIVTKYHSGIVMDIVSFGGIKFMQFLMTTIQNCMKNLILA